MPPEKPFMPMAGAHLPQFTNPAPPRPSTAPTASTTAEPMTDVEADALARRLDAEMAEARERTLASSPLKLAREMLADSEIEFESEENQARHVTAQAKVYALLELADAIREFTRRQPYVVTPTVAPKHDPDANGHG